jgi:hypothetical protein
MSKDEDRRIRIVFEQLRQEEERIVPDFNKVLYGKEPPHRAIGWDFWWRPAIALLLFVLAAGPVLYFFLRETGVHKQEISSGLEGWESPTDFLLGFNDTSLDSSLPEIGRTLWEEDEFYNLEN